MIVLPSLWFCFFLLAGFGGDQQCRCGRKCKTHQLDKKKQRKETRKGWGILNVFLVDLTLFGGGANAAAVRRYIKTQQKNNKNTQTQNKHKNAAPEKRDGWSARGIYLVEFGFGGDQQ